MGGSGDFFAIFPYHQRGKRYRFLTERTAYEKVTSP
jgi:hypothetical protein